MSKMKQAVFCCFAATMVGVGASTYAADSAQKAYDKHYNRDRFTAADTNGDGFLSKQEAAASAKGFEGKRGSERFDAADTNRDGKLSLEEATARRSAEKERATEQSGAAYNQVYSRDRFQEADTNGDGFVSRQEAAADKMWADQLGGQRFDKADTDGDGRLSLEEAKQAKMRERQTY
jgi:Ca2+-binding EF-hand superfamily protein